MSIINVFATQNIDRKTISMLDSENLIQLLFDNKFCITSEQYVVAKIIQVLSTDKSLVDYLYEEENKFKSDKIILGKKYPINSVDTFKLLLDNGADIHADSDWALIWASRNGHTDTVKLLEQYGKNI